MATPKRRTQRSARTTARIAARNSGTVVTSAGSDSLEARAEKMMDFQNEMKYINHDLRELMIISLSLFALLFVVGFFI